jgi:hypothetical protein
VEYTTITVLNFKKHLHNMKGGKEKDDEEAVCS